VALKSGVYQIVNIKTNERYIGCTKNFNSRKANHLYDLRNNRNKNPKLQNAYDEYGEENLAFLKLEYVSGSKNLLLEREQYWIDLLLPEYNAELKAGSSTRHVKDPKVKAKISQSMKEVWKDPEYRANYSKVRGAIPSNRKGAKLSDETKEKIRQANLGKNNPNYGKPRSKKTREKISMAQGKTYDGAVSPDGEIYTPIHNMSRFCKYFDLNVSSMVAVMNGRRNSHKGWVRV
jgi:group I intron endonuclease